MSIEKTDYREFFSRKNFNQVGTGILTNKITYNGVVSNSLVIVIADLFSNFGGLEKQGLILAEYLQQLGYTIYIYHSDKYDSTVDHIHRVKKFNCVNYSKIYTNTNATSISRQLKKINPDCIIALFSWNEIIIWMQALKTLSIPIIYSESSYPSIIKSRFNGKDREIILNCVDYHRVQHEIYSSDIVQSEIIFNFIIEHTKLNSKSEKTKAVYIGRLVSSKNIAKLIHLYAESYIELHLYGENFDIDPSLFKENIIYHGYISNLDKIYSNNFSYFHFPSEVEGVPNSVLESLSYGLPVVCLKSCDILIHLISEKNGEIQNSLRIPNVINLNSLNRQQIKSDFYEDYSNVVTKEKWKKLVEFAICKKNKTKLNEIITGSACN